MHALYFATLLAIAATRPSWAQNTAPTTAQVSPSLINPRLGDTIKRNSGLQVIPTDRSGVRLPAPVTPIDLTLPPLGETQRRKLVSLQEWGLRVPPSALMPALVLSPQQPYLANAGELRVATNTGGNVNYSGTPALPYGSVDITASPGWFVSLRNLRYTPRDWLLVECHVANGQSYIISKGYPAPPSDVRARQLHAIGIEYHLQAPKEGLMTALFPPSSQLQELTAIQISAINRSGTWQFGGCEITPVHYP